MAKLDTQVKFLRGLQAQLPTTGKEGSFYLTTDTDRLYVGKEDGSLALLNQTINVINTQSELPKAGAAGLNDFYFIKEGNILAFYNGTSWVQINPDEDTKLRKATDALKVSGVTDNVATVSMIVTDEKDNQATGSYKVSAGSDNVSIKATADGYSIAVAAPETVDYSVEAKDGTNENEVKVDLMKAVDSQEATVDSTVTLKATGKASIDLVGDAIVITGADQTIDSAALDFDANGNLGLTVVQKGATITASEVAPVIKIGTKDDEIKFLSGAADLPVYTMEEIDEKLANYESKANAMSYKGTVAAYEDLPTEGLEKGDLYMLSAADDPYEAGDLFIYDGEKWDYVPAGNDVDTTYLFKADTAQNRLNVVQKQGGVETSVGSVAVKGSGVITATPEAVGDNNLTITVSHNEVADTSPAKGAVAQEAKQELKFDIVESVTRDSYGHVSAVATKEITVVDTHNVLSDVKMTVGSDASITTTVEMSDGNKTSNAVKLASESLAITGDATNSQVKLELVWESFA